MLRELGARIPTFRQSHDPADHERAGALHQTGVPDGEGRRQQPGDRQDCHRQYEHRKTCPGCVIHAAEHMVGVLPNAGDEHHDAMCEDEAHEPGKGDEMNRPHRLPVEQPAEPSQRVGDRGALHQTSHTIETGAATNTVMK